MTRRKTITREHQKKLFNILKSVVEYNTPRLEKRIRQINAARVVIPELERDINVLSHNIEYAARFDPSDNDSEDILRLEDAKDRLQEARYLVNTAPEIKTQIAAVKSFNLKYNTVMQHDILENMRAERMNLLDELGVLSDKIDNAEINIDTAEYRNPDVVEISAFELMEYRKRYYAVQSKYSKLCNEIAQLEKIK